MGSLANVVPDEYLPRFEQREDGQVSCHYEGRRWFLASPIRRDYPHSYPGEHWRIELSFQLVHLPDLDEPTVPDNVVLGEN